MDQPIITQLTFFFSHYLSAWYHVDIVRRNSVLVTLGSLKVNRDCDTIPQLSNYSTKYFLHFSDEKCKTIHDILKEHTQFSQKKYSVTFTSEKTSYPMQPNKKITIIMQYIFPANFACYMVHTISWTSRDNFLQVQKCLAHQLFQLL